MAFSTDIDLEVILPAIFNYGIAAWDEYHPIAEAELVRDIRKYWLPRQYTVKQDEFEASRLLSSEWTRAACYRLLAWHALPRLATETEASGFTTMMNHYRDEYQEELKAVIDNGVHYDTGNGHIYIESLPEPESQRIWR